MNPPALRKDVDRLEVDLSSIASGYTIDRIATVLRKRGATNFMVELGGEVRAAGNRTDGTPSRWRSNGRSWASELPAAVPIANAAIATAGGTAQILRVRRTPYSHIIDPATGRPVEHELASVTVVADTCIAADGWDMTRARTGAWL